MLDDVKRVILVLSGKGGVGKSTVSTQLALTLKENGFKDMLLEVMRHSVQLIENKSTDTNTNQRKSMEWLIIQKRLAELTGKQRDVWQLKGFWRRLKMHAKKNVSDYKQAVKATGEGLIVLSLSEDDQKVINLCPGEFEDKSNDAEEKNGSHNNTMYDIGYNEDILNGVLEPVTEIKYEEVGLLDIDLCGPSVPHILNLEGQSVHQSAEGWVPVYMDQEQRLGVMSIGFLLKSRDDAVVWRGPKKTSMIKQFLEDVCWNDLDFLVIDTPPGTSDEHITVMENLRQVPQTCAILVTTPQEVAIEDVRKEVTFCRKTGIPILGIIENMSGFECPNCSECTNIFSSGGGKSLAEITGTLFLGCIPIDPRVGKLAGRGLAAVTELADSKTSKVFNELIRIISTAR